MKNEVTRSYSMSDGDMIQLAGQTHTLVVRDNALFVSYSYDATAIGKYKQQIDAFANFPTDTELLGDQEDATNAKTILRDKVLNNLRNMRERVKIVFEDGSGRYNKFGFAGISNSTDSDLLQTALRAVRCGHQYQTALNPVGVTVQYLDDLQLANTAFQDSLLAQATAISDRDIATEDRREMGNLLYAQTIRLADIGKIIWSNLDEAKYNDYVVYDSSSAKPAQQVVTGTTGS